MMAHGLPSSTPSIFVNQVVSEHSHVPLVTCDLWLAAFAQLQRWVVARLGLKHLLSGAL